jgi:hypothetical protein
VPLCSSLDGRCRESLYAMNSRTGHAVAQCNV